MTSWIGKSVPRVDGLAKVTGQAKYVADLRVPDMLFGKVLRSPLPHARIVRMDTSLAEQVPGVVAILTAEDLKDIDPYWGHAVRDRPVVAIDRVRFAGEPVAAVAAETESAAEEALDLIDVEYEPLPVVATVDDALKPDAPILHAPENKRPGLFHGLGNVGGEEGNVCYRYDLKQGDVEAAFAKAAVVVEGEYEFPAIYQYAMETHAALAQWGPDGVTIWATCQHPFLVRAEIAALFNLPLASVRIVVPYLGGGFGSKSYTKIEPVTAALARKAGRPVLIQNRVEESMVTTRRHGMKCWMRTAADAEGRLLARECKLWLDTGAYADNGPRVAATAGDAAPGAYKWEAVSVEAYCVYTNTPPAGSYRAFGAAHLQWIGETQVDDIARKLGIDPLEMRRRNLLKPGEHIRKGGKPLDADLIGDVVKVAEKIGWHKEKEPNTGRAVSVGVLAAGAHPVSVAVARMHADGTVAVLVSTTEMGQGAQTVFTQIAASELQLPIEKVRVIHSDTNFTPYDRSTGASRSTTLSGKAVQLAAQDLRRKLVEIAARRLQRPESELEVRDGAVVCGDQRLTYPELIKFHFGFAGGELIGIGEVRPEKGTGSFAEGPVFWEVCVAAAEVKVDPETGQVRVTQLSTASDVGRAINPSLIEGQEYGGSLQGLGNALLEEIVFENAQIINPTLLDYRIPGWEDLPERFAPVLVENEDGPGPYGSKGVGEGALAGALSAIAGALRDAGCDVRQLPMTPERVWRSLHGRSA